MPFISCVNISLLFFGAGPCCAPSSALGAGNQHKIVGSSGCGIVCDNIQSGLVSIRLFRVSAGALCESEGEGSNRQGCAGSVYKVSLRGESRFSVLHCYSSRLLQLTYIYLHQYEIRLKSGGTYKQFSPSFMP